VWYLNGEDSLGMSYEKEVRANGTTEHKHYIGAQGVVFAVFTSRAGNLNGLPASSTSYLHHDHLGSVAAISDEAGVRVEQLAFDPWGKRRYIMTNPGAPDDADAIVGIKTDRGYTMHEHLDEMALVHMNGRIYDPRIARFLSADPIIQAPYNLKAYNRYSYVWNNPLRLWDPTGYFWVHAAGAFALGFTVDLAIQAYEGKKFADLAKFDSLRDASIAGIAAVTTGALGGRLAVSAMRAEMKVVEAVTQTALVGGSTNALATITVETLHGKPPTVKDTALSFVAGTAGAYGGAKLANSGTRIAEKAREAGGVMAHIGTETLTPFSGGGKAVVGSSVGLEVGKVASDVGSVVGKEIADRELEAFDF
jgi:RHS repeat-associated protein